MQFSMTTFPDGNAVITAFIDGEVYTITSGRPQFETVLSQLRAGDESVVQTFDAANFAQKAFHKVTDRVNIRNGVVYLDDKPIDSTIAKVIMGYLGEGNDNALPLVRFMERLEANPSFRSREQFWRFVNSHGIHIDDQGYAIMYKSVEPTDTPGLYRSVASGQAFVNGVEHNGQIPSRAGDVVSMPRREISDDPNVACHKGLHCGARSYAEGFFGGNGRVLITVRVDPAHVVSVPTDHSDAKVRVEQYTFMEALGDRNVNTVRWTDEDDDYEDYDEDDCPF